MKVQISGEHVQKRRLEQQMTQQQLAVASHVSETTIRNIERETVYSGHYATAAAIARGLGYLDIEPIYATDRELAS